MLPDFRPANNASTRRPSGFADSQRKAHGQSIGIEHGVKLAREATGRLRPPVCVLHWRRFSPLLVHVHNTYRRSAQCMQDLVPGPSHLPPNKSDDRRWCMSQRCPANCATVRLTASRKKDAIWGTPIVHIPYAKRLVREPRPVCSSHTVGESVGHDFKFQFASLITARSRCQ